MKTDILTWSITGLSVLPVILIFCWWLSYDPTYNLSESIPGRDNAPTLLTTIDRDNKVEIGEYFTKFDVEPAEVHGSWPRFRGANFDNIGNEEIPLADNWDSNEPSVLWAVDLGEGHAAAAIFQGRVFVLDYDEREKSDVLRCFSLENGNEIWHRGYHVQIKRNHGISRTIPAVTERYVVTIGPKCHVMCVDTETGELKWGLDLVKKYGTQVPLWYTGQCPLIDDNIAVIAPGGIALLIGIDCETGSILWETPNNHNWQMSHSSIMPMTLNGKDMYLYSALGGLAGVSAGSDDIGTILWKTTLWKHSVIAPSPLVLDDGIIFVTAGYNAGSMLLKLTENDGLFSIDSLQSLNPKDGFASEQQTPIYYQGHIYGVLPKDAGALREQFVCYRSDNLKRPIWSSGKENRFGLGAYFLADGKFYAMNDEGVLTMIRATPEKYIQLGQKKVLSGHDCWGPLAITGGKLIARDSKTMICLDLRANQMVGEF